MTGVLKGFALMCIAILSFGVFWVQITIAKNQKLQMKQQFHSDLISLVSLLGENGLEKITSPSDIRALTVKESFAAGLLLQRFIKASEIRNAFSDEEWRYIEKDMKATIKNSRLLRARWEQVRLWHPLENRYFLDKIVFDNLSEKEKLEILISRSVNEKIIP